MWVKRVVGVNTNGLKCFYAGCSTLWIFLFKQKTAYEIGTGDWSSDVCSSDLTVFLMHPNVNSSRNIHLKVSKFVPRKTALPVKYEIGRASCRERV